MSLILRPTLLIALGGLFAGLNSTQGCDDPTPTPTPTPLPSTGEGVLITDGQAIPYTVDLANSRLVILVLLTDGCTLPFHNHAILSTSNTFNFSLNADDPTASTFEAIVHVPGLEADLPEIDALYPQTAGNEFTDAERAEIEQSMNDQIDAANYDTMRFNAFDLTTFYGTGTATVEVEIKGITSVLEMNGSASMDVDGAISLHADGILDGTPYGIYSGFGASCVSSLMPLDLNMVLLPAGG